MLALAITAGLLIFIVVKIYFRQKKEFGGSSKSLAVVLDGFPLPIFEIDFNHKVTQWNAAMEAFSGIKRVDVIGTDRQWKAFYSEKRPVLADLITDGASEKEIFSHYPSTAVKSPLIEGAYMAEDYFSALGENGKWYQFTASPIKSQGNVVGAIEILENTTERHIAEQNLRYYVGQITRVQEEERKHIARELHDTTVQTLVALIFQLDNFLADKPQLTENEVAKLKVVHKGLKRAVEQVRSFSSQIRPPVLDDLGLIPVLEWLAGALKKTYDVDVDLHVTGDQRRLDPDMELALFRIIQEALINSAKHSGVKTSSVKIEYLSDMILVEIADLGKGFDIPDKIGSLPRFGKLGLAGMEERVDLIGGKLEIRSQENRGTTVNVRLPL
jgi:signal transduction histidine kinase